MEKSVRLCTMRALPHVPGFTFVCWASWGAYPRERSPAKRGLHGRVRRHRGLEEGLARDVEVCDPAVGNPRGQATARRGEASCIAGLARRLLKTRGKRRGGEGREGEEE